MKQHIVAPQLGVWSSLAPATDNPAAQPPKPAPCLLAHLRILRNEACARATAQVKRAPHVWRM